MSTSRKKSPRKPKVRVVNGVRFETVHSGEGIIIAPSAPVTKPTSNSAKLREDLPSPVATEPSPTPNPAIHPYEKAGCVEGVNWDAVSIITNEPELPATGSKTTQPARTLEPTASESSADVYPKGHFLEGFSRMSSRGGISIVSNAPLQDQTKSTEDSSPKAQAALEASALEKFAARTPEEKAKFFLLFSKLLKDEVEIQRKPN